MIITIDGPAGAGKSSLARQLAQRLGFRFLDTGAMYRAVAWAVLQSGVDPHDERALAELLATLELQLEDSAVVLNGTDISDPIRAPHVTAAVRPIADSLVVRRWASHLQRQWAAQGDTVTEGRDQGTDVFPGAECKIYLTASPDVRAQRRLRQLQQRGERVSLEQVLAQQNRRDAEDVQRPVGALRKAADAIEVSTDHLTQQEVLERLEELVRQRQRS